MASDVEWLSMQILSRCHVEVLGMPARDRSTFRGCKKRAGGAGVDPLTLQKAFFRGRTKGAFFKQHAFLVGVWLAIDLSFYVISYLRSPFLCETCCQPQRPRRAAPDAFTSQLPEIGQIPSLLGARKLLGAPGLTTSNRKLLETINRIIRIELY